MKEREWLESGPRPDDLTHYMESTSRLKAERDRYREALEIAADDLGKAANQFAAIRESLAAGHQPEIRVNPEKFAWKEAQARAALAGKEDE